MKLSLDTHVVLWWYDEPERLQSSIIEAISDKSNTIFVSAVVLWEIVVKRQSGKLRVSSKLFDHIAEDFMELPISWKHIFELQKLEMIHNDPFDRLLVAQAITEDVTLVTHDHNIFKYPCKLMRA